MSYHELQYLGALGSNSPGSGPEAASLRLNPSKPKGGTSLVTVEVVLRAVGSAAAVLFEIPRSFSARSNAHSAILVNLPDKTLSSERKFVVLVES